MFKEQHKQFPLATEDHSFLCLGHVNLAEHSFIHSPNNYLLNSSYVSDTVLGRKPLEGCYKRYHP